MSFLETKLVELNDDPITSNINDEARQKIRDELSTMSFEDIQKLKEKIGSKVYDETVYGVKKFNKTFKRANKNRPREESSKIRFSQINHTIKPTKKAEARDPRFDPLCGTFDKKKFKKSYEFVNDIRKKERKQLKKELENTKDSERKAQIKLLIQRIDNKLKDNEREDQEEQQKREENRGIVEKLRKGERPQFKRKSEKQIEGLVNKFEELKRTNKLNKHIEKKSKKLAIREKRQNKLLDI